VRDEPVTESRGLSAVSTVGGGEGEESAAMMDDGSAAEDE
jgi:hypothetical protein